MGLLDNLDDPQKQMLLQIGLGLLGGAPGHNKSFGADLAHAGTQGLMAYGQQRGLQAKLAEEAQQKELRNYQLIQARQGLQDDNAFRSANQDAPNFAAPRAPNMAPTPENAAQLKAPNPYEQAAQRVQYFRGKGINEKYIKPYVDEMEKMRPKFKADQQIVKMPDGSLGLLNLSESGEHQVVPYAPAEELKNVNVGGKELMAGKYTGKVGAAFDKSYSPDALLGASVTTRGQDLNDSRAREGLDLQRAAQRTQVLSGDPNQPPMIVDRATGSARPVTMGGQPLLSEAQTKKQAGAKGVLNILDEAENLLPKATNTVAGRGLDYAVRGLGMNANEGDIATAQLQALEGALLAQMPRMEGPQSNYDVENYKKAAGSIGNPLLPREIRKAAIETIRGIQKKYADPRGDVRDLLDKYLKR